MLLDNNKKTQHNNRRKQPPIDSSAIRHDDDVYCNLTTNNKEKYISQLYAESCRLGPLNRDTRLPTRSASSESPLGLVGNVLEFRDCRRQGEQLPAPLSQPLPLVSFCFFPLFAPCLPLAPPRASPVSGFTGAFKE